MKITVVTPSIRKELLGVVEKCLSRQTFEDYEWLVGSPKDYGYGDFIKEPPKGDDYYSLNKAWNEIIRHSTGDLLVFITDGIWFSPDTLEKLWNHYQVNPKACVTTVGDQYDEIINGKPEHLVWTDPRKRNDFGSFYEISPNDFEMCLASIPKEAVDRCKGFKEKYDKGAALSEKEMSWRIDRLGYKFFIDQSLEYRAIKHGRLNSEWDKHYQIASEMYKQDLLDNGNGENLLGDL